MERENSGQGDVGGQPRFPDASKQGATRDAGRCVIASSTHPTGLRPSPAGGPARLDPSLELNQGDPPCSSPPWPRGAACSDRFWLLELRVSQHFSTFYEPSVQAMDTQLKALPSTLPVLARTVSGCLNSAFLNISQHFTSHLFRPWIRSSRPSTLPVLARTVSGCLNSAFLNISQHFTSPSVQAMDTQLNALPTLPVLARTVSGCLNSAFLGLF